MEFQDYQIVRNSFHGEVVATPSCIGVHARVYVRMLWCVWHALNRCLEQLCMCIASVYAMTCVVKLVYIYLNTLSTGYAHALVFVQFVLTVY